MHLAPDELRAAWYAVNKQMLPCESDSHKVERKVNFSSGLRILLTLPGPPLSQKKPSLYESQETFLV